MVVEPPAFGGKHARTAFGATPHTKRPIDKKLIAVLKAGVNATQQTTVLLTTTFPCTVVGLRWSLTFDQDGGTSTAAFSWAIVIVKEGVTVDTLVTSDAGSFFNPEENCLVFGMGTIDNNQHTVQFSGATKTMRKMQGGDILMFIHKGIASETSGSRGVIQFFCKT